VRNIFAAYSGAQVHTVRPFIATTQDHGRAWSLWTGGLYIQVVAKAGLTIHKLLTHAGWPYC
jgi:hypothetical protein